MSIRHLHPLLSPHSLVVVGASNRPGSVGAALWRHLQAHGKPRMLGGVHPVAPVLLENTGMRELAAQRGFAHHKAGSDGEGCRDVIDRPSTAAPA